MSDLTGKIALVTGASQGIGEAAVRAIAERGGSVVATDIADDAGEAKAETFRSAGYSVEYLHLDVTEEGEWQSVVAAAMKRHGKIDILVNNAGIMEFAPIQELAVDVFDRTMRVNVRSAWLGCKTILPAMEAANGGAIVNVSSISAIIASAIGHTAYATSKGAVRSLTKAVALEYVGRGIRVNSVHPGGIHTPAADPFVADPELTRFAIGRTPMKRFGKMTEIGNVIAFLASDESSYMTGSEVVVDGGWIAS